MIFLKFFLGSALALVVTTMLFWVMNALITHGVDEVSPVPKSLVDVSFIRPREPEQKIEEDMDAPDKVVQEQAPPVPILEHDTVFSDKGEAGFGIKFDLPTEVVQQPEINLGNGPAMGTAASDSDAVPLVRVQPMYPPEAAQERIEGWVALEFSINKNGNVENARVVASRPPEIFNRAALNAIKKWKYKAKIVNGERVVRNGIRVKLIFELEG